MNTIALLLIAITVTLAATRIANAIDNVAKAVRELYQD